MTVHVGNTSKVGFYVESDLNQKIDSSQLFKLTQDSGLPFNLADDVTKLIDTLTTPGFYYLDSTNVVPDPEANTPSYILQVGQMWKSSIVWQMLFPYQWINNDDKYFLYRNTRNSDGAWNGWRALEFSSRSIYLEQDYQNMFDKVIALQNRYTKAIGFITDTHYIRNAAPPYGVNGKQHVKNIAHFSKFGVMDMVVHGGDLINGKTDTTTYPHELLDMVKEMNAIQIPWAALKGNHDYGPWFNDNTTTPLTTNMLTQDQWHSRVVKPTLKNVVVDPANPTGGYFYKDFDDVKLRVICMNTADNPLLSNADGSPKYDYISQHTIGNAQLTWLANTALSFTGKTDATNWTVVSFSHVPFYNVLTPAKVVTNGDIAHNIIKAFKNHTTYSVNATTGDFAISAISVDFSSGTGRHAAHISGHYHDDVRVTYDSINYIRTLFSAQADQTNSTTLTPDTRPRTEGTVLEDSWSVFTIDTNARTIYMSRFGQGDDGVTITF